MKNISGNLFKTLCFILLAVFSVVLTNCDNSDPDINPGAKEICGDGIDQDCNGSDKECKGGGHGKTHYYRDADGDSYGDINDHLFKSSPPTGYVTDSTDCDDTEASI